MKNAGSDKREKVIQSEEVSVISSSEENPRRETEVDAEEEREARFGPQANEDMSPGIEAPHRRPIPTDRPLDISPQGSVDGEGMGMLDESDAETMERYFEAEKKAKAV